VAEVRTALKDYAAMDQLRTLASDLEQMVHSLNATASRGARLLREEMTDDETVNRSQLHQVLS